MFIFSVFVWKDPCFGKFKKLKLFAEAEICDLD